MEWVDDKCELIEFCHSFPFVDGFQSVSEWQWPIY